MTVDIKSKGGSRMTEIALHGLNVVAALDRGNGESVTQIVEACGWCADVSDNCA
jgi:hypothetical protein